MRIKPYFLSCTAYENFRNPIFLQSDLFLNFNYYKNIYIQIIFNKETNGIGWKSDIRLFFQSRIKYGGNLLSHTITYFSV